LGTFKIKNLRTSNCVKGWGNVAPQQGKVRKRTCISFEVISFEVISFEVISFEVISFEVISFEVKIYFF